MGECIEILYMLMIKHLRCLARMGECIEIKFICYSIRCYFRLARMGECIEIDLYYENLKLALSRPHGRVY